jgi:TRAP-type C4-dicarboxylate transport system permease small subunit
VSLRAEPAPAASGPVSRPLAAVSRGAAAAGSLLVLALVLLVDGDILGRELFAAPVRGTSELLALSIVAILFLQLPETVRAGRLARSELLLDRLRTRRPRLAHALDAAIHGLGAAVFLLLAIAVAPAALEAWREGLYVGAAGDFTAPIWPVRLVTVAGAALTALVFAEIALRALGRPLGSRS